MRSRRTPWILAFALAALAGIAALAAVPPNLARTLEAQRRLVAERPQDPAVYNDLGNLLLLVPQPAEAEEAYRKAVELDPDKVSARFNLGLLLQQRGELREAAKHFQQAVKLEPRHAWAHYQLGAIAERWGQEGKAVDEYAIAFSLDPQLAFPEVNAHIVENKLVTQAMLKAYKNDYGIPSVPQVYDEPGRIANLLIPPPAQKPAEADQTAAQTPPAAIQPGQAQQPTVLRPGDLNQGGATGQAVPQGQGRYPQAGGVRATPPPRGLREWNRPEPTVQEVPDEYMGDEEGVQPEEVVTPPPGGIYYRPGVQSTGRLNLRVMPERQREGRG
ncbi:MAG TPA: tetratricopeptide repeat protein [Thermoanaerobaculia bacterium]|nr:tetratricopeptide repeat protein [Thermoanaerobaculia bacterium]